MKYLIFLLLTSSVLSLSAQDTGAYQSRINWVVGEYKGYINNSLNGDTATAQWFEYTLILSYASPTTVSINGCWPDNQKICEDSIMMSEFFDDTVCDVADSLFNHEFGNYKYMGGFAKIYPDSTIILWYEEPPTCGGWWKYFKGKKTKSYAGVKNNAFNNNPVKLYPNPASNKLKIASAENIDCIEFYNLSGNKIKKIPLKQNQKEIDVGSLPKGLYFYKAYLTNHEFYTGKILLLK